MWSGALAFRNQEPWTEGLRGSEEGVLSKHLLDMAASGGC